LNNKKRNPWLWIPSLYYAEGLPYIVAMTVSVIMYKRLGISNTDIALYTSWLYLPWVIKPFWSPFVDIIKTKRWWIVTTQLILGVVFAGVAFTIPVSDFFQYTLAFFWLMAFSSATHDIAADGFYMLGLSQHDQAWFVGIRSTFYRIAMITGQGLLVIFAGHLESTTGLGKAEITVIAEPLGSQTRLVNPLEISFKDDVAQLSTAEIVVQYTPEIVTIQAKKQAKHEIDSLIHQANSWNVINGHIAPETELKNRSKNGNLASFWDETVENLESVLRRLFGKTDTKSVGEYAGNIGAVYFKLSGSPGVNEEIIVNFGRISGDKSLSLVNDSRFIFTSKNWNVPAVAIIQADPKLVSKTSALFSAQSGNIHLAWSITFAILCLMFIIFFFYHRFILPRPDSDTASAKKELFSEFIRTFILFFKKKNLGSILTFLLLFRFAEAQLIKLAAPFLLDAQETGGLSLTTGDVGLVYGTIGLIALTFGGLLGGFLAARHGLKYWLWPMALAINIPDVVYVVLSFTQTDNFFIIYSAVALEQFGYGFGFTAYMLFMIHVSEGEHKTAHFALTTAFMALGMMIPGMFSGWLQDIIGYQNFFLWVMICTIPAMLVVKIAPVDPNFGKKESI